MPEFNQAQFNGGTTDASVVQTTANDLVYRALRIAGVTRGPGRGPSDAQKADAFASLRMQLSGWNIEPLGYYAQSIDQYTLGSKQVYEIGKGAADFDVTRPNRIVKANFYPEFASASPSAGPTTDLNWDQVPGNFDEITGNFDDVGKSQTSISTTAQNFDDVPGNFDEIQGNWDSVGAAVAVTAEAVSGGLTSIRMPLRVWTAEHWARIRLQSVTAAIPRGLYFDNAHPIGKLYFWPIPNAGGTVELFTWTALPSLQTIDDTVVLPDGYEEAITYNLAVRVAAMFPTESKLSPEAVVIARDSWARIQSHNSVTPEMRCDSAVLDRRHWLFDILTGDYR